jgi:hypothetical protein
VLERVSQHPVEGTVEGKPSVRARIRESGVKKGVDSFEVCRDGVVTDTKIGDESGLLGVEQRPNVVLLVTGVGADQGHHPHPTSPKLLDLSAVRPINSPGFDRQPQQPGPQGLVYGSEEVVS